MPTPDKCPHCGSLKLQSSYTTATYTCGRTVYFNTDGSIRKDESGQLENINCIMLVLHNLQARVADNEDRIAELATKITMLEKKKT